MTNSKTTRRALLTSSISLLLCFTMLLGTTFAWFTDSAVTGSNVITAGNLDVEVQYTLDGTNWKPLDGATDLFQKGLWEPGHTEVVALKIENKGSLAMKYAANMNIVNETIGKTKDNKDIVLSDILTVDSMIMDTGAMGDVMLEVAFQDEDTLQYTNTASFKNANVLGKDDMLLAGMSKYLIVKVDMAETVGNEANHNGTDIPTINFGINVLATQFTYENDTFGNQYDKDAKYDVIVNNSVELDEAIKAGKTNISLSSGTYHIPESAKGKTLTITGSDNTIIEVVPAGQGEAGGQLDYSLDGSTVTFNNVTIKTNSQLYAGYARLSAVYNNCTIQNTYNLGVGTSEFNDCVFNITNEYLRVGGAYSATFNGCKFNTDGRAILVFQDGTNNAQTVTVKDCTFNATAPAKTWNGIHVAAVSIDGTNGTYVVNLEGTNTVDSDFNGLWQIKTGESNVTVNE